MLRKVVSLTSLLSFLGLLLTVVILYIRPEGRVAYWSDWHFWGLTKVKWEGIHINLGFLFIISSIFHIYLNWKAIVAYLKNKAKKLAIFTPAFSVSVMFTLFVAGGTYFSLPPMKQMLDLNDYLKVSQAEKYGYPPYGHAEISSLTTFCRRMDLDVGAALSELQGHGLKIASKAESLKDIAKTNHISPQNVYDIIRKAQANGDPFVALPPTPPEGTGKIKLAQLCRQYDVPLEMAIKKFSSKGIQASGDATIKQIANNAGLHPVDLYDLLRQG
jgi:hypothetical protein